MKKAILLSVFTVITAFSFAQNKGKVTLKNDTLFIPVGICNYIKIGDKVYKVKVALEEVQEPQFLAPPAIQYYPNFTWQVPAFSHLQSDSSNVIIPLNSINQ